MKDYDESSIKDWKEKNIINKNNIDDFKNLVDERKCKSWTTIYHQETLTHIKIKENVDDACPLIKISSR